MAFGALFDADNLEMCHSIRMMSKAIEHENVTPRSRRARASYIVGNFVQSSGRQSLSALQQSVPDIHNLAHVAETGMNSQDTATTTSAGGCELSLFMNCGAGWAGHPCVGARRHARLR